MNPKTILIGPHKYKVIYDEDRCVDAEANGMMRSDDTEIIVNPEISQDRQRVVLLHETLHAIFDLAGFEKLDLVSVKLEEKIINNISPLLLDVLRRNKNLIDFLLDK